MFFRTVLAGLGLVNQGARGLQMVKELPEKVSVLNLTKLLQIYSKLDFHIMQWNDSFFIFVYELLWYSKVQEFVSAVTSRDLTKVKKCPKNKVVRDSIDRPMIENGHWCPITYMFLLGSCQPCRHSAHK